MNKSRGEIMERKIKYYDDGDMMNGTFLKQSEELLNTIKFDSISFSINEIVEFFNIVKIFESKRKFDYWEDSYYEHLLESIEKLKRIISKYFNSSINNENIFTIYDELCLDYKEDFFELFEKCKLYDKISADSFKELLNEKHKISPNHLVRNKKIIDIIKFIKKKGY